MKKKFEIILYFLFLYICIIVAMPAQNGRAATADTKKEVYREISKQLLAGKKQFSVRCTNTKMAVSLVNRLNSAKDSVYYRTLFQITQTVDKKNNTDDGDYLYGNLGQVNCYYREGQLWFHDIEYLESVKQRKAVNRKVNAVAKKIRKQGKNNYEKIALTYRYVVKHVTYDRRKNCNYSAYAGFYKKKTVCNGYALMMYKLLMKLGIPCRFVSGSIKDGKKWYLHAWNIVKLKGKWYNLDACQDDEDDGQVYSDYFLKNDKTFQKDHKKDSFYRTKAFKKKYPMSPKSFV
ncbi:MAG: transglutaminase domain-containing protein [Lachnospiraceae bacterium]|nr:transglutaminase domain-containing protein [Lachnospiraceae bacterium]